MKSYTTLQPTRTVMRTHLFDSPKRMNRLRRILRPILGISSSPIEVPGLELWIMIEPSGDVWTWDGWMWN